MLKNYLDYEPKIGEKTWVAENATVIGRTEIGKDCGIWFGCIVRGDVNFIKIGDHTNIQDLTLIHVTHAPDGGVGFPTIIGDDVTIGHHVTLHGCKIGNGSLIGMGAVILDGAEIGEESLVAAGSVVTQNKKFPPRSFIIGTPAKVLRKLSDAEVKAFYKSAQNYVEYKNEYLNQKE